jgi:hypothetical protein
MSDDTWASTLKLIAIWYAVYVAVLAGLYAVIGMWAFLVGPLVLAVGLGVWVWRRGGLEPGEMYCLVVGWRGHVRHYHWPRREITGCTRSAGLGKTHEN